MSTAPEPGTGSFVRSVFVEGDRTLIQSTCLYCGTKFISSVADGLPQVEAGHLAREHGIRSDAAD